MSTSVAIWLHDADEINVLHATEKVVNLITNEEKLVSLVTRSIGDGPHNVVLPLKRFDQVPSFGQKAEVSDGLVRLNQLVVELSEAEPWPAELDWGKIRSQKHQLRRSTQTLGAALRSGTPDPGVLLLFGDRETSPTGLSGHFAQAMVDPADLLMTGMKQGDFEASVTGASRLAGLGTGLTPAGDDFISGAMLACWSGFCDSEMISLLPELADQAARMTTRLSAAYLRSAAEGQFGAIWHDLLYALIDKRDGDAENVLEIIMSLGHNSGAYTLAGFLKLAQPLPGDDR